MYTGLMLFVGIVYYLFGLVWQVKHAAVKTRPLWFWLLVFFVVPVFFICSFAYMLLAGEYSALPLISPDSLRYVAEANMFKAHLMAIDELYGVYKEYHVTPKMGMSSLLAWISYPWGDLEPEVYYLINNLLVAFVLMFCFGLVYDLCSYFDAKRYFFFVAIFFLFLPTDIYWYGRLLRESMANIFLLSILMSNALYLLTKQKKYLCYILLLSIWLIMYRPQLVILSSIAMGLCDIFTSRRWVVIWASALLLVFSLVQSIMTMGLRKVGEILSALGLELISPFLIYLTQVGGVLCITILGVLFIWLALFSKESDAQINDVRAFRLYSLLCLVVGVVGIVLFFTVEDMQIRFVYPYVYFFKVSVFCFIFCVLGSSRKSAAQYSM
ncbi:hypothetical protein [Halopseudomonas pelagia]|uniref:hypothetical protein n=1 Tax=Halopseudomonas pelagia TaxID=553151 RepID=UPI00039E7339|nr:hypothetical protein [Halopseudomonas pelagia]